MDPSSKWGSINLFKTKMTPFIISEHPCSFLYCFAAIVNSQDTFLPQPLNSPHKWAIPKRICYDVCKGSLSEKRSVSLFCFQICPLKESDITMLHTNCLKTYKSPLGKSKSPGKMDNPMTFVMWFTKLKKGHKRSMKRHHFSTIVLICLL